MARKGIQKIGAHRADTRAWNALREQLPELANLGVVAGVLEERYGNEPVEGSPDLTMAELFTLHEYGAPRAGIPERSSLRKTMGDTKTHAGVAAIARAAMPAVIKAKTGAQRIKQMESLLSKTGVFLVNAIKDTIRAGIEPPLAPKTLAARVRAGIAGTTPLIATRHLINAITWAVRPEKDER